MPRPSNPLPDLPCACANLRRAARLVTQLYSQEMGRHLEPAQFGLLSMLSQRPGISQSVLGPDLGLDKTTLSRNLRLLERNGWLEPFPSEDKRERGYRLTPSGKEVLDATRPGWQSAQSKLQAALQPGEWETLSEAIGRVAEAARAAQRLDPRVSSPPKA